MHRIGEDRAERLDIVPAQLRVLVTVRPKYACRACTDGVTQAPAPPALIEAGLPGAIVEVTGDGRHFEATVTSAAFEGKSPVQQHQMVYGSLGDLMQGAVHALALRTFTPQQWEQQIH